MNAVAILSGDENIGKIASAFNLFVAIKYYKARQAEKAAKDAENNKPAEDPVEQVQTETTPSGDTSSANTGSQEATQPPPAEGPPKTTEETIQEIEPTPSTETPDTPFESSLGVDETEALTYWEDQEEALRLQSIFYILPTKIRVLSNVWGKRVAVICENGKSSTKIHNGWDLSNDINTEIIAVADGTIIFSGWLNDVCGNSIIIDHGNGIYSHYYHLNQFADFKVGDFVGQGWMIAYMGKTGSATGYHLHFAMSKGGIKLGDYVDPANYITLPSGLSRASDVGYNSKTGRYYNIIPSQTKSKETSKKKKGWWLW